MIKIRNYTYELLDPAPMNEKAINSHIKLCTECGKKLGSNPLYFEVNTSWQLMQPNSANNQNSQGLFPIGRTCASKFDPALLTEIGA